MSVRETQLNNYLEHATESANNWGDGLGHRRVKLIHNQLKKKEVWFINS